MQHDAAVSPAHAVATNRRLVGARHRSGSASGGVSLGADDSAHLLHRLAAAAGAGLSLLLVGLAALALAVVAAATMVIGAAARVAAALLGELAALAQQALPRVLSHVPVLARAALILATGASVVLAYPALWGGYAGDTGSMIVGGAIAAGLVLAPVAWAALSGKWASLLGAITGTWAVWTLAHLGAGARTFVVLAPLAVVTVSEIFNGRGEEHARGQYEAVANAGQAGLDDGNGLHDMVGVATVDGR